MAGNAICKLKFKVHKEVTPVALTVCSCCYGVHTRFLDCKTVTKTNNLGLSYQDREAPKTLQRGLHLRETDWVQIWTIPARSGSVWTGCSLCSKLWTGTPALSPSKSDQTHPGPLRRRQKTAAARPCSSAGGSGSGGAWPLLICWMCPLFVSQRDRHQQRRQRVSCEDKTWSPL